MVAAEHEREHAGVDERRERRLDPPVRTLGVSRGDRQVAVIDDRDGLEEVDVERGMVGAEQDRGRADRFWPEAGAGPEARRRVEGDPDRRRVHAGEVGHVRQAHERPDAGETRIDPRVDRPVPGPAHGAGEDTHERTEVET